MVSLGLFLLPLLFPSFLFFLLSHSPPSPSSFSSPVFFLSLFPLSPPSLLPLFSLHFPLLLFHSPTLLFPPSPPSSPSLPLQQNIVTARLREGEEKGEGEETASFPGPPGNEAENKCLQSYKTVTCMQVSHIIPLGIRVGGMNMY